MDEDKSDFNEYEAEIEANQMLCRAIKDIRVGMALLKRIDDTPHFAATLLRAIDDLELYTDRYKLWRVSEKVEDSDVISEEEWWALDRLYRFISLCIKSDATLECD